MRKLLFLLVLGCLSLPGRGIIAEEASAGAEAAPEEISVQIDEKTSKSYKLKEAESAKEYVNAYADNVQHDKKFADHIHAALATIRQEIPGYATFWAIFPSLLAIILALITKEVYSSLFLGVLAGGVIYANFNFEKTIIHTIKDGYIASVADAYNIGILIFLVLLGALVAMMNKTGGSAAFGRWATTHIKSRVGAQVATVILGVLIFVDDYFNCLTVGSVMRPVTDAKRVSRAKLAYLIDATAAPICIIAPISSWAAAVAGFAGAAGAKNGFALFIEAIPYNLYAWLSLITIFFFAITAFDLGSMKQAELNALNGHDDTADTTEEGKGTDVNMNGRVWDLIAPMVFLIAACVVGMIYSGGFFTKGEDGYHSFMTAFSNSDASIGLAYGSAAAVVFAIIYYLCRRVVSFRDCMKALPDGFNAMVPAILILCFAWTLKTMTDSLGAKVFISEIINGPAADLQIFLPAIIFVIALVLAFASGTSWGTFGILIPIVLAAIPNSELSIIAISACMAGSVCGDHCSPISDTTIMASAGAGCNHVKHVSTQLPLALLVAGVSFCGYLLAASVQSKWIVLPASIVFMLVTLTVMKHIFGRKNDGSDCR